MRIFPVSKKKKWFWVVRIIFILLCAALIFFVLPLGAGEDNSGLDRNPGFNTAAATESVPAEQSADISLVSAPPASTPAVTFIESGEMPLPGPEENLQFGQRFNLSGTVYTTEPITSVSVVIRSEEPDETPEVYETTVTFNAADDVLSYLLEDAATEQGLSLSDLASFDALPSGRYEMTLMVSTVSADGLPAISTRFTVDEPSEWLHLTANCFHNNYSLALRFFGDPERFLFRYQWADGRLIITDPNWVKKFIVSIKGVHGQTWKVHIDAVPHFEQALAYLNGTFVRVEGNGHDSGVIRLADLIASFNGAYYSRFVSDRTYISHHALGTAIDFNAHLTPNNNAAENRDIIRNEVKNHLVYNGIIENGEKDYYDFTYTGNWPEYYRDVPTSVMNDLLYELAFFRAGFGWGYFYPHTSDAMHFTLTERDTAEFSLSETGLRKVFIYE